MKKLTKISAVAIAATLLFGGALSASAQTVSTSTLTARVSALLQQIKTLQDQLVVLQTQQGQVMTQLQNALQLTRQLRVGMSGDDVKALQQMLASDPSVYPEGLVTGKFGPLTEKAVKKFQAKHGFEQVGNVGPKTMARLNELFKGKGKLEIEDNDDEHENASSTSAKAGEFKALVCHKPEKNKGGETLSIGLPAVMAHLAHGDRLGACSNPIVTPPTSSTTPDVTAPVISSVTASSTSATTTDIKWSTNENATGAVWYGTSTPLSLAGTPNTSGSSLVSLHTFSIGDLATGTTYYYVVKSVDAAGNSATSSQQSFVTSTQ